MKSLAILGVAITLSFVIGFGGGGTPSGEAAQAVEQPANGISVEPFVWAFKEDYPGVEPADWKLPIDTVYVKTHEGTTWMSKWDDNSNEIYGPDAVRRMIGEYKKAGIRTIAWFVPEGKNYEGQLAWARAVIDAGVDGLYADIEPYPGFCDQDCAAIAENFWKKLRIQRPDAELGVIYDPRPQHWEKSGIYGWMSVADVALPMCYWETFAGQSPWGDPRGCIFRAASDLKTLGAGRDIEYVPIFQGDTSPEAMKTAIAALEPVGADRMSIWRRGIVQPPVWNAIAEMTRPAPGPQAAVIPASAEVDTTALMNDIESLRNKRPRTVEESIRLLKLIERAADMGLVVI